MCVCVNRVLQMTFGRHKMLVVGISHSRTRGEITAAAKFLIKLPIILRVCVFRFALGEMLWLSE